MLHQQKAPMYIRTAALLRRLCAQAQTEGRFALDLEFIREHSYVPRLALIQMAVSDTCAIVDPLEVHDLSPLLELCKSAQTLKVLHAAGQDRNTALACGHYLRKYLRYADCCGPGGSGRSVVVRPSR